VEVIARHRPISRFRGSPVGEPRVPAAVTAVSIAAAIDAVARILCLPAARLIGGPGACGLLASALPGGGPLTRLLGGSLFGLGRLGELLGRGLVGHLGPFRLSGRGGSSLARRGGC